MAVGLKPLPALLPVAGIRLGTAKANIRKPDRRDLVVIECAPGTRAAAVFTKNRFCAAPVDIARAHLALEAPRALLINTGFANAGTGAEGREDALACCAALAHAFKTDIHRILPFSTGVIGERLPVERVVAGLPACVEALCDDGWHEAAHGIMTTDTLPKGASREFFVGDRRVVLTGICKGAGMIEPNMATMLAFIATDAGLEAAALERALAAATRSTFNRISVDGDTSTNDACVLLASGTGGALRAEAELAAFGAALEDLMRELAQAIVRDAEGATKFMTVKVINGASEADCLAVAYTVARSPLVKTAFFASDPNWGRILAAIGRAPIERLDVARVSLHIGGVCVAKGGARAPGYREADGARAMRASDIEVLIDLASGNAGAEVWTCDLSHDYVRINAEYRS